MGNCVVIEHVLTDGRKVFSLYAHLASIDGGIAVGNAVHKSQLVGEMGGTGYGQANYWSTHLHFELKNGNVTSNPSNGGPYWGYTPGSALNYGYQAPEDYIPDNPNFKATCASGGIAVGSGSSRQQAFIDCYNRHGSGNMGSPVNSTHWVGANRPVVIQDFQGGAYGDCAIVDDEARGVGAWVIRGALRAKYFDLGSSDGPQGPPRSDEGVATPSSRGTTGAVQTFERGHIHASPLGVYFTLNQIDAKYAGMGGSGSVLGFPQSDEYTVHSSFSNYQGWVNVFEGGYIYHSNEHGTFCTRGGIGEKYQAMGAVNSVLGFPIGDEVVLSPDHYSQNYEGGIIYSRVGSTVFVAGAVNNAYNAVGGWNSFWGWPSSDNQPLTAKTKAGGDGFLQYFDNGYCYNSPLGAFLVRDPIRPRYQAAGWEAGTLGYPTSADVGITSSKGTTGWAQSFEAGNIYYSKFGVFVVNMDSIRARYAAQNWENGPLGMVISERVPFLNGTRQEFEGGSLTDGVSFQVTLNSSSVMGGSTVAGKVTLPVAAPTGGITVTLASSNPGAASVPSSITVPQGATQGNFQVVTTARGSNASVTITAKLLDVSATAALAITKTQDVIKPALSVAFPAQNERLSLAGFSSIRGTATDNVGVSQVQLKLFRIRNGVRAHWNGSSFVPDVVKVTATLAAPGASSTTWNYAIGSSLKAALDSGEYFVYAYVQDASGNNFETGRAFTLDVEMPKGSITTPAANQTLPSANFGSIAGTATDNIGVASVKVKLFRTRNDVTTYWNGANFTSTATQLAATIGSYGATNTGWSFSVSPELRSKLDSGVYLVYVYFTDTAGNAAGSIGRSFTILADSTKPVPVIVSPSANQRLSFGAFNAITGSATDNVGVTQVLVKLFRTRNGVTTYWNGSAFTATAVQLPATVASPGATASNWSFTVSPALKSNIDSGTYVVYAYGLDAAGNLSGAVDRVFSLSSTGNIMAAPSVPSSPAS